MKNLLMIGVLLLAATVSNAARTVAAATAAPARSTSASDPNTVTGLLGMTSSSLHLGVDYERRMESTFGVGGYFFLQTEKKDAGIPQIMSFGALAPVHVMDNGPFDVYVAPGFGIHMIKGLGGASDETAVGPAWKIGAQYRISHTVKLGLENTKLVNWFSDKAAGSVEFTSVALGFTF